MNVELKIDEPKHGQFVKYGDKITLQGSLSGEASMTLYYRWYSSFKTTKADQSSINQTALTRPNEQISFDISAMGSHPVALVASDRTEENIADYKYFLTAGGSDGKTPCVIHVLKANILAQSDNATITHDKLILKAEAPSLWDNEKYQKYNRLSYRWELQPVGDPAGRPTIHVNPLRWLLFQSLSKDIVPCLVYAPAEGMPVDALGRYKIILSVVDKDGSGAGVTSSVTVTLT